MATKYIVDGYVARGGRNGVTFDGEETDMNGKLTDASLNWGADQNAARGGLPQRFNTSAVVEVRRINRAQGRIISAPAGDGYANHCLLFGIDIKTANNLFSNHQ